MPDHWQPGDLARCVDVRDLRLPFRHVARGGRYLKAGMLYPVDAVSLGPAGEVLLEVGVEGGSKLALRFVKVPPLGVLEALAAQREHSDG